MAVRLAEQLIDSIVQPIKIDGQLVLLLDQRKIPESTEYFDATSLDNMCLAIKDMIVRGAPAIGVAAAIGLACEAQRLGGNGCNYAQFLICLADAKSRLQSMRPTAVNLRWATELIYSRALNRAQEATADIAADLFAKSLKMIEEDKRINMSIGENGAVLLDGKSSILTHCNAGALATCGWGTALGVIRSAVKRGAQLTVYVDETRPRLQGAKLTAWELLQDGISPTVITDSMAGYIMAQGKVDLVVVGADRISINGDAANKIGTYGLAVLANAHDIPFYIAAPLSTIDPLIKTGKEIPIEHRDQSEVTTHGGVPVCPPGTLALNPSFDVTPARLISGIITEVGILRAPYEKSIPIALGSKG